MTKKFSEDIIISDDLGNTERFTLPSKLDKTHIRAIVKAGTPIIQLIKGTKTTISKAGLIFPETKDEQERSVLARDILCFVIKEVSNGVFECLHRAHRIFVRYNDLIFTEFSKDLATLKDKDKILK